MNIREFAKHHPKAFEALPDCYQNDNCLQFWYDSNGIYMCAPADGEEDALGEWTAMYNNVSQKWDIPEDDECPECDNCGMIGVPLIDGHCEGCICQKCHRNAEQVGCSVNDMGWCDDCEGELRAELRQKTATHSHKSSTQYCIHMLDQAGCAKCQEDHPWRISYYKPTDVVATVLVVDNYTCTRCGETKLSTSNDKVCWSCGEPVVGTTVQKVR